MVRLPWRRPRIRCRSDCCSRVGCLRGLGIDWPRAGRSCGLWSVAVWWRPLCSHVAWQWWSSTTVRRRVWLVPRWSSRPVWHLAVDWRRRPCHVMPVMVRCHALRRWPWWHPVHWWRSWVHPWPHGVIRWAAIHGRQWPSISWWQPWWWPTWRSTWRVAPRWWVSREIPWRWSTAGPRRDPRRWKPSGWRSRPAWRRSRISIPLRLISRCTRRAPSVLLLPST
mmetsp:Transcript_135372/g.235412  ORF Transcript_135372/g.235412 Transcript_135372/m.235412 type:complete len:223 (+) Transcript_135372:434-1102(+)